MNDQLFAMMDKALDSFVINVPEPNPVPVSGASNPFTFDNKVNKLFRLLGYIPLEDRAPIEDARFALVASGIMFFEEPLMYSEKFVLDWIYSPDFNDVQYDWEIAASMDTFFLRWDIDRRATYLESVGFSTPTMKFTSRHQLLRDVGFGKEEDSRAMIYLKSRLVENPEITNEADLDAAVKMELYTYLDKTVTELRADENQELALIVLILFERQHKMEKQRPEKGSHFRRSEKGAHLRRASEESMSKKARCDEISA